MKRIITLAFLSALGGCTSTTNPTPSDLADNFRSYDDRHISTCGQITAGGGKCTLKAGANEIWLSSAHDICTAKSPTTSYANISGLFSALGSGSDLVIRKANIEPIKGECPASDT